jgi:hypothetical protein
MLRAKIVFADTTTNLYRVFIPELHSEGLPIYQYPLLVSYGNNTSNIITNLHENDWIWVDFEKSDTHFPFMVSSYNDKTIVKNPTFDDIIHIVNRDTGNGIHIIQDGKNISLKCDNDIELSINGIGYKSLMQQINDMSRAILEIQQQLLSLNANVGKVMLAPIVITQGLYNVEFKPKK